jgi:hypothetical protein
MRVEEVHFNHATSSATSDALNLRKGASSDTIQAPGWKRGWPAQLFAPGGTIARRSGQLVARSMEAGVIDVEAFLVEAGRAARAGTSRITVQ